MSARFPLKASWARHPLAPTPNSKPTIWTATTLTIVIDGKIMA
jgi:hypothetical protein